MLPETQVLSTFQMITLRICLPFSITIWLLHLQHWGTVLGRQSRVKGQAIHVRPILKGFPKSPTWKLLLISISHHYVQGMLGRYSFFFNLGHTATLNKILFYYEGRERMGKNYSNGSFFFLSCSVSRFFPTNRQPCPHSFSPFREILFTFFIHSFSPPKARTRSHIGSVGFLPHGWYGNYTHSFIKPVGDWSFPDHKPYNWTLSLLWDHR